MPLYLSANYIIREHIPQLLYYLGITMIYNYYICKKKYVSQIIN